ncbi:MAG: class I SAM-dependent DNA methyltransferase [Sphingomonas fennica]
MEADAFVARWRDGRGGQERANYAMFLLELCDLIGVARPDQAGADHDANDYVFERVVRFPGLDAPDRLGRIDLYKRGAFLCECKQSRRADGAKGAVPLAERAVEPGGGGGRADAGWDALMKAARHQAMAYVAALPVDHPAPPFLIVCDIGRCLELYADFSGTGRLYALFPDRRGYRIFLDDLRDPAVRDLLRKVWEAPHALDATRAAAQVTRGVATRLARVSRALEVQEGVAALDQPARGLLAEEIALFLMRLIFSMFAEDVGLLPPESLTRLLERAQDEPDALPHYLAELWGTMDRSGGSRFSLAIGADVRYFNGGLFRNARVFHLPREELGELVAAARADWQTVEPAIFGTLLEQALDPADRTRLGAHYTPRPSVERVVNATMIDPLRDQWRLALLAIEEARERGEAEAALAIARRFHAGLAAVRVLDPACGTGNFLYVAMLLLKRLEAEVRETILDLRGGETFDIAIDPHNFLGLELNPRAAAIAELVLWIGYLQWHFANHSGAPAEPILRRFGNINGGAAGGRDALLAADAGGLADLAAPRPAEWPAADYIVGNPPFLGGKDIRRELGGAYAEALWRAHRHMPRAADLVMYWWDRAAGLLQAPGTRLRRFGFVTTNSITQSFSRRVIAARLAGAAPLSIVHAVPDHPWTRVTRDAAAVRIAMTVVARGEADGLLRTVTDEADLDTDTPAIGFAERHGRINADLTIGADVTLARPLAANAGLSSPGMKLHGAGFIVSPVEAEALGLGRREGLEAHVRPYCNGRDLTGRSRGALVIDLFGIGEDELRLRFPEVWTHIHATVGRERAENRRATYRDNWWLFGEPRRELRPALAGLTRYIATVETAKHRLFQFLDGAIVPDNMLVAIASADAFHLGVLSSRIHMIWSAHAGGTLEDRPRYTKGQCFDPFPFPDPAPGLRAEIAELAEELDATRKAVLADRPELTLTALYNLLGQRRSGTTPTAAAAALMGAGRIAILDHLHQRIDQAVAAAYGWPEALGAEAIVAQVVALNAERRREEQAGRTRWLRPDHQAARVGRGVAPAAGDQPALAPIATPAGRPPLPRDPFERSAAIMAALAARGGPVSTATLAGGFRGGRPVERSVERILAAGARVGLVTRDGDRWLLPRG